MVAARYFIDKNGARTSRILGQPGSGHVDIAKDVPPQHGVRYAQMFRLRFMRVVEHDDDLVEIEF